jgi:predicted RNase H-like HicB family nuclease
MGVEFLDTDWSFDMKKKHEYRSTVIIEPCEEGGYFGMCPEFPGCHVQGETYEETLKELRSAINAFIEDYKEEGEQYLGLK